MAEQDGSENPFLRLYMRQLSQNLDVLSSILSHLFMVGRVWTTVDRDLQLRVLEEDELFTILDHKANTSEDAMTDEEDTGPPPPDAVEFDVDKALDLLDIVLKTKDLPTLSPLSGSAMQQLVKMAKEVQEETDELQEKWKAAYAEWENKKKAEAEKKRKEEEEKEDA